MFKKLKFYDPEENMESLNRLFDILGVLNLNVESLEDKYYGLKKNFKL